jgi:pilus assembly protein CpaE
VVVFCDPEGAALTALRSAGAHPQANAFLTVAALRDHLSIALEESTVVLGPNVDQSEALKLADSMRVVRPRLGVVLIRVATDTRTLQEALRSGVREVIDTQDLAQLAPAIQRSESLAAALRGAPVTQEAPRTRRGQVVTVFSAKGGCGKTTLATNLAVALADRGRHEVCLIDLDLTFGDVAIALQLFPQHTIADAVPLGANLDYAGLQPLLTPHSPGLAALVAPLEPGSAELIEPALVGNTIRLLREHFDYIVVDTPPAFDEQVLAAFDQTDVLALIATLDLPALKNLKVALETLDLLNFAREKTRIVLNRADSKVGLTVSEVEKSLRVPISLHMPSSRDVPAAINRGVPIMIDDPKHPVSLAIRQFAERYILGPGLAGSTQDGGSTPPGGGSRPGRRGLRRRRGSSG